jgi:hypothetical protein
MSESDSPNGLLASPAKEHPMAMRLPASQRTREELTALIEGRLSTASAKDELIKLASRLIVEEALEGCDPDENIQQSSDLTVGSPRKYFKSSM